jgi:glycosyltransferase involved in cell wall biosynthesis
VRVLINVPWSDRRGGAEAMLQTVLDGVDEGEHELEIVFLEDGSWPAELVDAGVRVCVIPAGRLRQAHRWLRTVIRLATIFRHRRPDVIFNWSGKTQLYGAPAAMLAGMSDRVIWFQHAIPARSSLDACATLLPARGIVCYSRAAAQAQARLFPHRPTPIIPAGAVPPSPATEPPPLKLPATVPVVGLVGRLQPWKGQDRLLRAQALLRARGRDMHTVIVGGDSYGLSPEYARQLAPLVHELGLDDAVTMTGEVPDAGPYIEQMDILVNASDPEPFGIVLLEAMARAVPVVAVDAGGPAEVIEHGQTGWLAGSGAPEALADALEPLLASPALRRSLGQAGRERFMREYTDVAMRERFFGYLETIVRDKHETANGDAKR